MLLFPIHYQEATCIQASGWCLRGKEIPCLLQEGDFHNLLWRTCQLKSEASCTLVQSRIDRQIGVGFLELGIPHLLRASYDNIECRMQRTSLVQERTRWFTGCVELLTLRSRLV